MRTSAALAALCLWTGSAGATGPVVTDSPGVNPPSTSTNVSGTGFGANEVVDLYFDTTDEELAVTNAGGAFAATSIGVPASALPGTHWITAEGRHSGLGAQTKFSVETNWAQQGYGPQNRAFNPYENVLSPQNVAGLGLAWSVNGVAGPPTEYLGSLFVALKADEIAALNPTSGATIWSTTYSVTNGGALTESGGHIFFGNCCGAVSSLNTSNGVQNWAVNIASQVSQIITEHVTVADGVVYAGSSAGTMFALNETTGATLWTGTSAEGGAFGAPTVAKVHGQDYVMAVCDSNFICDFDKVGNTWALSGATPPTVMNGRVYYTDTSGNMFAAQVLAPHYDVLSNQGVFGAAPAAADNVVYAGTQTNFSAYDLDLESGNINVLWTVDTVVVGEGFSSQPAVANGVVYVGDANGVLHAFSTANGALLWTTDDAINPITSTIVVNGMLFATDTSGILYAYALNAGNNSVYHRNAKAPALASLHPDMSLSPWHHAEFRSAEEQ